MREQGNSEYRRSVLRGVCAGAATGKWAVCVPRRRNQARVGGRFASGPRAVNH